MLLRLWKTASLERVLGCDLRSLALLRVTIAIILLTGLCNRISNFDAFLTEDGLFPRLALIELYSNPYIWSVNNVMAADAWQALLLLMNFASICLLLFGYQTRAASVVCWVLEISLQAKNPILMQSGDVLLRNILFWGMFLPWGAKYSIDSALSNASMPKRVLSYATIGVCLQTLYVYFFSVFLKTGAPWRQDGTAVYYALHLDHFSTVLGKWLLTWPLDILKFLNYSVLGFEFFAPILLLIPWGHAWLRPVLILSFWFMHLSFGSTLSIGNFVLVSIASTMPFIPTETWDWISRKSSPKKNVTAYYDEDCGFCIKMVKVVREFLFLKPQMFKPAQSDPKIEKLMLKEDSWVLVDEKGFTFLRAEALKNLLSSSSVFFWAKVLFAVPGFTAFGNQVYNLIAANRARDCKLGAPKTYAARPYFELSTITKVFLAFSILYITLWNIGTMPRPLTRIANHYNAFAMIFRFDQKWEMFAPFPLVDDGWFIVKGKLSNSNEVDVFRNGEAVDFAKPKSVKDTYKDFRWRKYMVNLWGADNNRWRKYYGQYLCRSWNNSGTHSEKLLSLEIIYMKELTPPPGEPLPEAVPTTIWSWICAKGEEQTQTDSQVSKEGES